MHLGLQVYVVDDVTTPAIKTEDLLIIGSASGNTKSLVQYAGQYPYCHSMDTIKNGSNAVGTPKFLCKGCERQFVEYPKKG